MISKKDIISDKNPLLRNNSVEVTLPLSKEDQKTLDDMLLYLSYSQDEQKAQEYDLQPGVGIAAPQIGILKKMFCVLAEDEKGNTHNYALVNPEIVSTSVTKCYLKGGEGCLSVPDSHVGFVPRYLKIKVKAYDYVSKQDVLLSLKGYLAVVVQHEYDHLFGTLYYDRINTSNPTKPIENAVVIE